MMQSGDTDAAVGRILKENAKRNAEKHAVFNPITGEGSTFASERVRVEISDFPMPVMYLPKEMMGVPMVRLLVKEKTIERFFDRHVAPAYAKKGIHYEYGEDEKQKIIEQFVRIRIKHDYPFWAAFLVYIKNKGGGEDVLFRLNRPQRRLVERLERRRLAGQPIRLVLLKARQWGGSTCIQMYIAWLQLVHKVGLNSLIIAHQGTASDEIEDMFRRMIGCYQIGRAHV